MTRILMLARHFPPIGGAGVHRTLGSVRHLGDHGFEPVVVTGTAEHQDRWEPRDGDLLERIPATVQVHRVPPARLEPHSRRDRLLGTPPPWIRAWVRDSAALGVEVGRGVDLVYASCLPYETARAGAAVARALGVPWVADLEDPWALDEMRPASSRFHAARELRRMRAALATASAIVMAAPEAVARLRAALPELAGRITVTGIPIGFEPDDFPAGPVGLDGVFRIVHTGSLHTDFGEHLRRTRLRRRILGGTEPGLDVLTRSHVFLVQGVERLIAREPRLAGRIELHLAGELTDADRIVAARHDFVRTPGLLSHRETVALMRRADVLFLPMHDLPAGRRAGLIPYKTYEYLAAGRPILAAVPDGDVRDMLEPLSHATLVRPADVEAMAAALRGRIEAADAAPGGREPDAPPPRDYERAASVARIAELLDGITAAARQRRLAA